jgi:hypothetical protein
MGSHEPTDIGVIKLVGNYFVGEKEQWNKNRAE